MAERFVIEDGKFGPQLVLQSAWSEDVRETMRSHGILELGLNYARGFVGDDIVFVTTMPELEALWIIHRNIEDVSPVHALGRLETLQKLSLSKTKVNSIEGLARLGSLQFLGLYRLRKLRSLHSLGCLAGVTELEEVLFYGSTNVRNGDLGWLGDLPKLKNVWFQNRRQSRRTPVPTSPKPCVPVGKFPPCVSTRLTTGSSFGPDRVSGGNGRH